MSHSRMVRASDVVRILRLRDELDELSDDPHQRWQHVLGAAGRMFGAVLSTSGAGESFLSGPEHQPSFVNSTAIAVSDLSPKEELYFYRYMQGDHCVDPCVRKLAAIPARLFT